MGKLKDFYEKRYKFILAIPMVILAFSIIFLINFYSEHNDIVEKDVSLKGGISATLYPDIEIDIEELETVLKNDIGSDFFVRSLGGIEGSRNGFLVETSEIDIETLENSLENNFQINLNDDNFFVEQTGSRLGQDFYKQMIRALIIAFVLMSVVVLITFRSLIPSLAVILSALFDIVVTIVVIDIIGIRISSAGIAALLLLVGYSIDTDILLTTRILKMRGEGEQWERLVGAVKTGLTMTVTSMAAVLVAFLFSISLVLKQMFLIIFIGLIADIVATYMMNAEILTLYMKRKYNE